jgi:Tfp pilus assembly protein PilV
LIGFELKKGVRMQVEKRAKTAGFSQLEILVALGIFSISLTASIAFFSQANRHLNEQTYLETRVRIFQNLIYMMGMPATLRGSLENDTPSGNLWKAVRNGMGPVPTSPWPIALFLPVVAGDATTVQTAGRISGPPGAPLRYSTEGIVCDSTVPSGCDPAEFPISVSTEFLPVCPPAYDYYYGLWSGPIYPNGLAIPTSCNRAQYIKIFYHFFPTPGAPSDLSFTPLTGSIMVSAVAANVSI